MKVGIMSMQRIINYGSFLQAYGLKKTIESLGHEVIFVDYSIGEPLVNNTITNSSQSKIIRICKMFFSSTYRRKRKEQISENQAFSNFCNVFSENWLPKLEISEEKIYSPDLDVLIIGSDEVFNCTQSNPNVGYSLELFGKNNNAKKLISYAASFGSTTLEKIEYFHIRDEIAENLRQFNAISVRDNNSHEIVKSLTDIEPIDHVDPVLISDYEEVSSIIINKKNYVIVYAYSGRINDEEAKAIQEFAHKKNKKTLSIGVRQAFTDEYVCVDPFTMLAYFKNADYVITDTFHGTVFSIKYQIPFATIIRESNKEKIIDLLDVFDLSRRKVSNIYELENIFSEKLDNEEILKVIHKCTSKSLTYLSKELKKESFSFQ